MTKSMEAQMTDKALAAVRGELSSGRRGVYRLLLVVNAIWVAAVVSLWLTEPGPLPPRLHAAFAGITAVGAGWIAVLTWILTRRSCPTALDRIATGWMACGACSVFLMVAVPIAILRDAGSLTWWLAATGGVMLTIAGFVLRSAYAQRRRLMARVP